ncbi:MAG: hypothetical protein MAG581_01197 [Deltaproteobacteria bacterium]|nr:hypothetical protein [Deltaproteobacteria bacterium]
MSNIKAERKVTVILATDVVGYSTKMEMDENQTLKNLAACRSIVDSLIEAHHGRIFNTAGDSVLAEFPSAVEAVFCAREFQDSIRERNRTVDEAEQLEFRVGINMGDVVVEGENLLGEGVNVAARLEALAQVGGICVSKNIHEAVHKKMELEFNDLGQQKVKNTVMHAVDISLEGISKRKPPKPPASPWQKIAAAIVITTIIVGGGVWWWQRPDFQPADQSKFAFKLPDKPSIAVLPFNNMSGDASQDYIADGLSENIITVLATSRTFPVISRNSSFTFRGQSVNLKQVAKQLGVRYVLEGSVQQSGKKLRVTAQLVDAVDGKHLWADRYDRTLDDLFAVQDEITEKIFEAMQVELTIGEQARDWKKHLGSPDEMRLTIQGLQRFLTYSPQGHKDAERLWGEVFENNPEIGMGNLMMGWLHFQKIVMGWTKNPKQNIALARQFSEKAHSIMGDGNSLTLLALLDAMTGNCKGAIEKAERAVEIDPSAGDATALAGGTLLQCGRPKKAAALFKLAIRLQPYHPKWMPNGLGKSLLAHGEYDEAEEVLSAIIQSDTKNVHERIKALTRLTVTSVFKEDFEKAKDYLKQLKKLAPNFSIATAKANDLSRGKMADQEFMQRYLDALRQLGIPEQSTSG